MSSYDEEARAKLDQGLLGHPGAALNAETPPHFLDEPLTPASRFFVRNNGHFPNAPDAANWRLCVEGEVERPLSLSLADLRDGFAETSVTAVLECAGNGRAAFAPATSGVPWRNGAVGCARWTGVRMRDILAAAGVRPAALYVAHESPDRATGDAAAPAISRGLPLAKALADETLVAWAMNGAPLPLLHGFPLRVVAPGYPGSAWQKWLARLWVREREHDGALMEGTDYRLPRTPLAPGEPTAGAIFDVITDMPVRSLITAPGDGFLTRAGARVTVRGYGWSGHTPLQSVMVSGDRGTSWQPAALEPVRETFAWRRFAADVTVPPDARDEIEILAQATDAAGRRQPIGSAPWNPRGYCNNAVHVIRGHIMPAA